MARIKYYNTQTGKWEHADSQYVVGGGGSGEDGFSPIATVEQTEDGAVISITDKNGNTEATIVNGKDGKDGKDGKSAYEYAQNAGYTRSESVFAAKLAEEHLLGFTSEITPQQVYDAVIAGRNVVLIYAADDVDGVIFTGFVPIVSSGIVTSSGIVSEGDMAAYLSLTGIVDSGEWRFSYNMLPSADSIPEIPDALPNPNALTFTGAVSGTYDGSDAVSVEIPKLNYNPVTPQVYGAKGDGTTDDTAAFRNALANNRTVFVPGGTYNLSGELVIRDNCQMELAQDVVLNFTNTSGKCITLNRSAFLKGNHATVKVPYEFTGIVVNADTSVHTNVKDVPPFTHWCPQWKTARYLTDLNICKANSYGLHESLSGESNGTAVYIVADKSATSTFIWGMHYSGLRIAGSFEYGIRAVNLNGAYNHEMRIEAFIDACKIGVSLEDCNNAYLSTIVQPRKATDETLFATHGIQLIRSRNTDMTGSRVWDWGYKTTLWTFDKSNVNQHIALYGDCKGTILNDYAYHDLPSGFNDLRELIYTDTPANFDSLIILQEPFTRWFRKVDNQPFFNNGDELKRLALKEETDAVFTTKPVKYFDDKLASATDASGAIFNGVGYKRGGYWNPDGKTFVESTYHTCTGFIKCGSGQRLHVKGMSFNQGNQECRIVLYDSNYNKTVHVNRENLITNASYSILNNYTETEDGFYIDVVHGTAVYLTISVYTSTVSKNPMAAVNEEIEYGYEACLADSLKIKYENVEGLSEILGSYITDVDVLLGGDG